jgi:hypothetical protein
VLGPVVQRHQPGEEVASGRREYVALAVVRDDLGVAEFAEPVGQDAGRDILNLVSKTLALIVPPMAEPGA